MKRIYIHTVLSFALLSVSCTKLEEKLHGQVNSQELGTGNTQSLLVGTYTALKTPYQDYGGWWALQQITSDESIIATRGGDWDDNGAWRALFLHRWESDHARLHNVFRDLNGVNYAATDILRYSPTSQQEAEARFIRAFAQYSLLDGWGQVPYRDPGEGTTGHAKVRGAAEQIEYLISEINAIIPNLPDGPVHQANKDAAKVLLMKTYLNKGAFLNRNTPSFDNNDLNIVISLADEIINSGRYELADDFFSNFSPNNHQSTENIYTAQNIGGQDVSRMFTHWSYTTHYNMNPSGANGLATLSDFYDKFEQDDERLGGPYPGMTEVAGVPIGFMVGQQYNQNGEALMDRRGNPLSFTREINLIERGNDLEIRGIRVIKYAVDYPNHASRLTENDWVFYRYSDVLLMKAEALLRAGQSPAALALVNEVREKRNASQLNSIEIDDILDERGREFYWEGHRRTDLIRFGKFLDARQEKPESDIRALLFPIPQNQIMNPNYEQNPGY